MAMILARTSGSAESSNIFQMLVNRLPQYPACMQREWSSLTMIFSPSNTFSRLEIGPVSAFSPPSNGTRVWVLSQNGLVLDRPHRHRR